MSHTPLLTTIGFLAIAGAGFAAPAGHIESWVSGRIARVDAVRHTMVVQQGKHELTYQVASDARVLVGGHAQATTDLRADVGRSVRVRYSTSGTRRIADRIEIGSAPTGSPAPAAAPLK